MFYLLRVTRATRQLCTWFSSDQLLHCLLFKGVRILFSFRLLLFSMESFRGSREDWCCALLPEHPVNSHGLTWSTGNLRSVLFCDLAEFLFSVALLLKELDTSLSFLVIKPYHKPHYFLSNFKMIIC